MSYVFHQQDLSVQQYSGRQKVGKDEEADLGRHGRTRYVMTYKRWMSARRRPSLLLVTARTGDHSSPGVPAGRGRPNSKGSVRRSIKLANFCGRGLGAEENWPMTVTHVTCQVTTVTTKKRQTMRMPTLLCCFIFLAAKQHKKRTKSVCRWLLDR